MQIQAITVYYIISKFWSSISPREKEKQNATQPLLIIAYIWPFFFLFFLLCFNVEVPHQKLMIGHCPAIF